jgi:hypothetical protein
MHLDLRSKRKVARVCAGTLHALHCTIPLQATLHIYGFNWHEAHTHSHDIRQERDMFTAAEEARLVVIHPTGELSRGWFCQHGRKVLGSAPLPSC